MDIYKHAADLIRDNKSFVIATIIKSEGSVPGKVGFKMVVHADGSSVGTVGGGAIEKQVIEDALQYLIKSEDGTRDYILSDKARASEDVKVISMSCSGRLTVFYEAHGSRPTVYVFGGGHVGQALLYHLKPLDYHTVLIDNRNAFAARDINPDSSENIFSDYEEYARQFIPVEKSYVVILTHGHKYDSIILNILHERRLNFSYIGIIASKTKAAGILKSLRETHGDNTDTSNIYTPVGLKIGGTSAAEIGLAIAAEMQTVRYGKTLIDGDKKEG
ncbi:MAG: XdhC family protein [Calditrichaeota bacterium]|nr:XdhC family protein [Calditrichota bacterium]